MPGQGILPAERSAWRWSQIRKRLRSINTLLRRPVEIEPIERRRLRAERSRLLRELPQHEEALATYFTQQKDREMRA